MDNPEVPAQPTQPQPNPEVGFPAQASPKKSKFPKWILLIIGIIIIVGVGGFFVFRLSNGEVGGNGDSQTANQGDSLGTFDTPAPTNEPISSSTPSPTPKPIAKDEVSIEVLNGTGVPGEASFLKDKLEDLDYVEIDAGNADEQDASRTTVTFSRNLSSIYVEEITELLEDTYEEVTSKKGSLAGDLDVRIISGTRKDADTSTPAPTTEATTEPTPSAPPAEVDGE